MATDCSDVSSSISYDCAHPWGENCTSKYKFQFTTLWTYTQRIQAACPNDTRLFLPDGEFAAPKNASLTQESCDAIAGSGWTYYPTPDIWNRITTWKFPLLQLVASFPRPPLSKTAESLVILHLLGDPIDTIQNLIFKISTCQDTASYWKKQCRALLETSEESNSDGSWEDRDRDWKALAIINDAYGEWNKGHLAQAVVQEALTNFSSNPQARNDFMRAVRQTGRALAADRSTKFLPIVVAQIFFIGAVAIAIFRTAAAAGNRALSDTVFINVEAHSIAFSALYFWIIPAVFLSSVIGVSQTEAAIPRILRRFQIDLDRLPLPKPVLMPNDCLKDLEDDQTRIFQGGIYSWQPFKRQWKDPLFSKRARTIRPMSRAPSRYQPLNQDLAATSLGLTTSAVETSSLANSSRPHLSYVSHALLPYAILILGTVTGMAVSALVPPDGFNCRHFGQILICIAWILSAQADRLLNSRWALSSNKLRTLFWVTAVKDLLMTVATMGGIIATQVGVFNRCVCYTKWGRTGVALPEQPDIAETLFRRLNTVYPAIAFTSIGLNLVFVPLYLWIYYRDALRVFVQRDDRRSNAAWFWKTHRKLQALRISFRTLLSRLRWGRPKPQRAGTRGSAAERGDANGSQELPTLTHAVSTEPEDISASAAGGADEGDEPTLAITPNTQSESSSVEPPLPSGTNPRSRPEPRRRNTEPQGSTGDDAPFIKYPQDDQRLRRKPLPTASPLQHSQLSS